MFKKQSLDVCDTLTKAGYTLYENNQILISKQYNKSGRKHYFNDFLNCFSMLFYGIISIIGFPFVLICTLFSFIPKVYIKDGSIDEKKRLKEERVNRELEERFGKKGE